MANAHGSSFGTFDISPFGFTDVKIRGRVRCVDAVGNVAVAVIVVRKSNNAQAIAVGTNLVRKAIDNRSLRQPDQTGTSFFPSDGACPTVAEQAGLATAPIEGGNIVVQDGARKGGKRSLR